MSRRRRVAVAGGAAVVVLGAWLTATGLSARAHLLDVLDASSELRTDLLAGDVAAADRRLADIRTEVHRARAVTDSLPWRMASHVPLAGRSVSAVRAVVTADAALADSALPDLVAAGQALSPAALRVHGDTIDLGRLHAGGPALDRAARTLAAVEASLGRAPRSWLVPPVRRARGDLARQLADLTGTVGNARAFARIAPAMLGENGVRRYFVAVQNNAESRGTGGLVGAWLMLTASGGRLRIEATGSDVDLVGSAEPVVDLGSEFNALYRRYASDSFWANSNLSPDFPRAAQIWVGLWRRMTGQSLDGALAVDPVALADVLVAAGTVRAPDGTTVTADNVVSLTESTVYARYAGDDERRKTFLQSVARAVADQLLGGAGDDLAVAHQLGRAAHDHHLALWSAHPGEQAVIARTPIAAELPAGRSPVVGLVVDNLGGNKLDYWLRRSLDRRPGRCLPDRTRATTVVVRLSNQAPVGLPDYVVARFDDPVPRPPRGTDRLLVEVYLTAGAEIDGAWLDGAPTTVSIGRERTLRVVATTLELAPDTTRTLRLTVREPHGGHVRLIEQPLAVPLAATVGDAPPCR